MNNANTFKLAILAAFVSASAALDATAAATPEARAARQYIERSAQIATHGEARVTSRDRTGALASPAHARGAVDFSAGGNPQARAAAISPQTGSGFTSIYERPARPERGAEGPSADLHHIYRNGSHVRTYPVEPRATGPHIHVQPDRRGTGQGVR